MKTLVLSKITVTLRECDVFNTECRTQRSSHRGWENRKKEVLKSVGMQFLLCVHRRIKTDRKPNQIKPLCFERSKNIATYISFINTFQLYINTIWEDATFISISGKIGIKCILWTESP